MFPTFTPARRALMAAALALPFLAVPALAADPAETFVAQNIQKGLAILNNRSLSQEQRRDQLEQFLKGLTDVRRVSTFTLGSYRRAATPADLDAFDAAFLNFVRTLFEEVFSANSNQTLRVVNSTQPGPTDYLVTTELMDSSKPGKRVMFRVRTDGPRIVVTDIGTIPPGSDTIWMAIMLRDQFTSVLARNNGNIRQLITDMSAMARNFKFGR